ncbi:MAG: uridine kinase [Cytophagales bacterium]|nr:uridine kinase [Cytophagales bacterium]
MNTPYIIGICGGSGSGKTTFLENIISHFAQNQLSTISLDHYYNPIHEIPADENGVKNFDDPTGLDIKSFESDIEALMAGQPVFKMEYNYNNPTLKVKQMHILPAPVIVVEGIFLYYFENIKNKLALKIFVDTPQPLRAQRRIMRDTTYRGNSAEEVQYSIVHHVEPAYQKYILPYIYESDIIVPNSENMHKATEVIVGHIQGML